MTRLKSYSYYFIEFILDENPPSRFRYFWKGMCCIFLSFLFLFVLSALKKWLWSTLLYPLIMPDWLITNGLSVGKKTSINFYQSIYPGITFLGILSLYLISYVTNYFAMFCQQVEHWRMLSLLSACLFH